MVRARTQAQITCEVEGCEKPVRARCLCNSHYIRLRTLGDPLCGRTFSGGPLAWIVANLGHRGSDCLIWPYARNNRGYGRLRVNGRDFLAHRYMLIRSEGEPPHYKSQAMHTCGGGSAGCCNPQHLRWGSQSENEADKTVHSTDNRGERNGRSVLSRDQVLLIIQMRSAGSSLLQIQNSVPVSITAISSILTGKNWGWLTGIEISPNQRRPHHRSGT